MREKLLSIGDDFWIEDSQGRRAYKVNGKALLRVRESYGVEIAGGEDVPLLLAITVAIDSLT